MDVRRRATGLNSEKYGDSGRGNQPDKEATIDFDIRLRWWGLRLPLSHSPHHEAAVAIVTSPLHVADTRAGHPWPADCWHSTACRCPPYQRQSLHRGFFPLSSRHNWLIVQVYPSSSNVVVLNHDCRLVATLSLWSSLPRFAASSSSNARVAGVCCDSESGLVSVADYRAGRSRYGGSPEDHRMEWRACGPLECAKRKQQTMGHPFDGLRGCIHQLRRLPSRSVRIR